MSNTGCSKLSNAGSFSLPKYSYPLQWYGHVFDASKGRILFAWPPYLDRGSKTEQLRDVKGKINMLEHSVVWQKNLTQKVLYRLLHRSVIYSVYCTHHPFQLDMSRHTSPLTSAYTEWLKPLSPFPCWRKFCESCWGSSCDRYRRSSPSNERR